MDEYDYNWALEERKFLKEKAKRDKIVIKNLKIFMADKNYTQSELARRTKISQPQINQFLNNKDVPIPDFAKMKMALVLGRTVKEIDGEN